MKILNFKKLGILSLFCASILLFTLIQFGFGEKETVELTTYYPAPYGDYLNLNTTNLLVGNAAGIGYSSFDSSQSKDGVNLYLNGNMLMDNEGQSSITLRGHSDGGQTYSAIYLGADDLDTGDNSWVISHMKLTGHNPPSPLEEALVIGKWPNPFDYSECLRHMVVQPDGDVGFGTDDPQAKVHIVQEDVSADILRVQSQSGKFTAIDKDGGIKTTGKIQTGMGIFSNSSDYNKNEMEIFVTQKMVVEDVFLSDPKYGEKRWASEGSSFDKDCYTLCGSSGWYLDCNDAKYKRGKGYVVTATCNGQASDSCQYMSDNGSCDEFNGNGNGACAHAVRCCRNISGD